MSEELFWSINFWETCGMKKYQAAILVPNTQSQDTALNFVGGWPTKGENRWPTHPQKPDTALHLLVQLSCEDLHAAVPSSPIPHSGVLQFFIDTEQFINTDDKPPCRVIWQSNPEPTETLPAPTPLEGVGGRMWSYLFGNNRNRPEIPQQLPKTGLDFRPIETSIEHSVHDVAELLGTDLSNYGPDKIGPWNFWHQALGDLPPDLGGGPLSRDPKVAQCVLLLRLVCDEEHGLDWDGHHNPSLTFWISPADLEANRWDQAFALFTDF